MEFQEISSLQEDDIPSEAQQPQNDLSKQESSFFGLDQVEPLIKSQESKSQSERKASDASSFSHSANFTPLGLRETQKSCTHSGEQPQSLNENVQAQKIKSVEELMALLKDVPGKKIVIDGKTYDVNIAPGDQISVGQCATSSPEHLKNVAPQKSMASDRTAESKSESDLMNPSPSTMTPLPPMFPVSAPPSFAGLPFNLGSITGQLMPMGGQDFTMPSPGLILPMSFPAPSSAQMSIVGSATQPKLPPFNPSGFNFSMMQQNLQPLTGTPQLTLADQITQNPVQVDMLRPSGRDQRQTEEVDTQEGASSSTSCPQLKKSISDMTDIINSKLIIDYSQIKGLQGKKDSSGSSQHSFMGLRKKNEELEKLYSVQEKEITQLNKMLQEMSDFVIQHFSQKSITNQIRDSNILEVLSKAQMANAKVHLAFLFSSPLVKKGVNGNPIVMQQIDHHKEFAGMYEGLNKTNMRINYLKVQATADKLVDTLNQGPIAIHFSGHGIKENTNVINTTRGGGISGYLVFEDNTGQAQLLSDTLLKNILQSQGIKPEFVFVASCHSQFAGNIFHQAGAKHVICIQHNQTISDEASICFSQTFYKALYNQNRTVCQAFEIAKSALGSHPDKQIQNEASKFMMLKSREEEENEDDFDVTRVNTLMVGYNQARPNRKKHICRIFGPFNEGKVTNAAEASLPMFRIETSKIEDFIGRTIEMHTIIQCITEKRVVNIMGIPGIGKTTLVKAVAHFLDERQHFRNGIIILSLRNLDQVSMIITRLELVIKKKLKEEGTPGQNNGDEKIILEKIVSFFADKEILLIMDNAETPSKKDPKNFSEFIKNILDNCPSVRFLFTSRYNIGSFENNAEQVIELKELHMKFAVELLKKKASRKIEDQEIEELLRIRPDKVLHSNPLRQKEEQTGLESHHMFEILKGHPHAISLAAPLLQNKKLKELYELLNSDEIMNWLENQGIKDDPMGSLKVSMDISIKQLSDTEPQAIKLFWLIGLLPGGCTKEELDQLWGDGWLTLVEKLLRSSLLVKKSVADENIYQLFPFMNQYAATNMNSEEKIVMHRKITKHYLLVCKALLREHLDVKTSKLVQIETNIWGCIYRMKDKQAMQVLDDDSSDNAKNRSPKNSHTTMSHRVSTPMSAFQKHSNGEANTTSISNQSESGAAIEVSSTTHSKSRLSNLKSEKDSRKGAKSAMDTKKYNQVVSSNEDDDSSDVFPKSQGDQPKPLTAQSDTLSQQNLSESHFNDKYDSILSQRIQTGLNKMRSKSERGTKLQRKTAIEQLEEVKELQPPPQLANKMASLSDTDSSNDQEVQQIIGSKNMIQISYSQPQQSTTFDHNIFYHNSGDQTQYQDHPEDQSFSESIIEPQLPLATRKSSMEGQGQRFDSLFAPANQQTHSLNSSFNLGGIGSGNFQSTPQQLPPFRLFGQNASHSRLDQSFSLDEPSIFQNNLAQRQRPQPDFDQISNFSAQSLIPMQHQQQYLQNDLFDNLSNDGTSLIQQLDRLNLSSNSAAQGGLSFMTQGAGGQLLLDQSMSYVPTATSYMNISQSSRANKNRNKYDQAPYTEVPEPILEESMTSMEEEAEICASPTNNRGVEHKVRSMSNNEELPSDEKKHEESEENNRNQNPCLRGQESEDTQFDIEERKSNTSSDSNVTSSVEIAPSQKPFQLENAVLADVDGESLDLNQSITHEDMQNNKLTELDDTLILHLDKPEEHKYSSLKKGEQRVQKRVTIQEAPEMKDLVAATDSKRRYQGKTSKLMPPTVFNKTTHLSTFTTVTPQSVSLAVEHQTQAKNHYVLQAKMSEDGALVVYYITNLLIMAKYEDSLKVIDQCQEKFEHDRICTANLKKLQAYALQQQVQHSRTAKTSYKEVKSLYKESLKIFTNMKNVLGQAICHWALGFLFYSHKEHFESAKKDLNYNNITKKKFEEAARCYNEMKHYAGESVCHRFLSNLKNKMKESYIEHVNKQKQLMTLENHLQKQGKSNFVIINGSLDGIEASLYLEVIGSPLDIVAPIKPLTNKSMVRSNNAKNSSISQKRKHLQIVEHNENSQLNIQLKATSKNEDKKDVIVSTLANVKAKYQGSTTSTISSVKQEIPGGKKPQIANKKDQKDNASNSAKKSARKIDAPQEEQSDKKVANRIVPKLNLLDVVSDCEQHDIASGKLSQEPPLSQRRKLEFSSKNSKEETKAKLDEKAKKPEMSRRPSILKVPNAKESLPKIRDMHDIIVQEVDDVKEEEQDDYNSKSHIPHQSIMMTEDESESEDLFEKIARQNEQRQELSQSSSRQANKPSSLQAPKNSQKKQLYDERPQWRSALRQSVQNQVTVKSKDSKKPKNEKEQSPKNEAQACAKAAPQQDQTLAATNNRADTSIASQQAPIDQNQFVSFNITTTTTVKIEGKLGNMPPSLLIGPSLQVNHPLPGSNGSQ